ncbi:hypothetical protein JCM10296v2_005412 [Rhodotorula toruloides]
MPPPPTNAGGADLGMVGTLSDEETISRPTGFLSLPDELIARIYHSHIFVPNLHYPDVNVAYQWRLTCINRRIYHLARPLAFNHLAINDADSWMPSLLVFLAAQAVPLPSTTSLLVQVETQKLPLVMVMAPRLLPNLTILVLGIASQGGDDRSVLPRYVTDVLPHFQQLQRLQIEDFESLEDEDFDIRRLSSLKDLILKRGATTQLAPEFVRHGADLPLHYLGLLPTADEDIPMDLAIPWGHWSSLTLILYGASAAYTALLDKLNTDLTDHRRDRLPLTDIFYIILNLPCLQYLFLDAKFLLDCLDGHHLLKQPTLANSPHLPIFEPNLSALVQSLQSTTVLSFTFRPTEPFGLFTHRQLRWLRRSPKEPHVVMPPPPTNAGGADLGMVGTLSDEDDLTINRLILPARRAHSRIYASTLALDIRILPMENPFDKWKTAFVNRRIYEIAKPVFLSHIAVDDAGDPVPMVLAFLARQAEPLRTTRSLHLEVEVPLLVLAAALAPPTEIIPHFQQLRRLDIECYDSLADETFTSRQLPCLQSLRLRRSTTNGLGIQLLRDTTGTALSEVTIYSQDTLPAQLSLPWERLSALSLQFWDEYACYKALRKDLERTKLRRGQFPLRMLDVNAPWREVSLGSVTAEHPHVKAFVGFLKVVFRRAPLSRLKIEGLTSWPPQLELLRNEGLERLELRWTGRETRGEETPDPPRRGLPLPPLHHILSCFPKLTHFDLDIRFLRECLDGDWLYQNGDPASPLADIFEPNLTSLVRYLRSTTIVHFAFRPSRIPDDPDDKVQLRWTRASPEEDFVYSKWTCMH